MLFNFFLTLFKRSFKIKELRHKKCVQRGFELRKISFIKKNFICKENFGTVTKTKLVTKIRKHNQLYFRTLVLTSYCYCGDNT